MSNALIGFTGFVGGNLLAHTHFDDLYNSKNISKIRGKSYDLVICAGAPAAKWLANQNPQEDLLNIQSLISHLEYVDAGTFLLISTVDVYPNPVQVYESNPIDGSLLQPYGRHRYQLEQAVNEKFSRTSIVRLPGLFGPGLKKNIIYDLLHDNVLCLTHYLSEFQFYDLNNLWADLAIVLKNELQLINFATEPVSVQEMAATCFNIHFTNVSERPPVHYDMRTEHAEHLGIKGDYIYSKDHVLAGIKQFVDLESRNGEP
jgi:nucleoside-diphosphate-sugar epimerase